MALGALGQFALPVSDPDVSENFYANTLGLKTLFRFDQLVFFDCGGVRLMLEGSEVPVATSSGVCHYFRTEDINKACTDLVSRGVELEQEPHLIATMPDHELWMAFFEDPDGHSLALMEERKS